MRREGDGVCGARIGGGRGAGAPRLCPKRAFSNAARAVAPDGGCSGDFGVRAGCAPSATTARKRYAAIRAWSGVDAGAGSLLPLAWSGGGSS